MSETATNGRVHGMGGHQSARMDKDEWLTPPAIIKALGPFDLDPCAPRVRPWEMAAKHYTLDDNGLLHPWHGRVWCNPPYGRDAAAWLARMVGHRNGIALIFARTETEMFHEYVWNKADAVLFLRGRLHFHHVDGTRAPANAGAPSALVAYGAANADRLAAGAIAGYFVPLTDPGAEHG
jgi:hypothetical protein